jgi:hypothetical protein
MSLTNAERDRLLAIKVKAASIREQVELEREKLLKQESNND